MYRGDDGEQRVTKEDDVVFTFLGADILEFLSELFGHIEITKSLTPPIKCPECGEWFEDAPEDHRLKYRKRHRDEHDRWITVDEFHEWVTAEDNSRNNRQENTNGNPKNHTLTT